MTLFISLDVTVGEPLGNHHRGPRETVARSPEFIAKSLDIIAELLHRGNIRALRLNTVIRN